MKHGLGEAKKKKKETVESLKRLHDVSKHSGGRKWQN